MLPELGILCLVIALCSALGQGLSIFYRPSSVINLGLMQIFCIFAAYGVLSYAFLSNDFSVQYVAHSSNSQLPWYYKITAVWGAHEGSLLLWITILNVWYLALYLWQRKQPGLDRRMIQYIFVIMGLLNAGLLWLLIKTSNPFARYMLNPPMDGADLNPMLQDLAMIIHPPILYLGYVGTAAAFAITLAALWTHKTDRHWAVLVRPWVRVSWVFLTLGITLGSWWAYYELGWGGWWFWDPVENASFIPWLTLTALLHNLSVSAKQGKFMRLGVFLVIVSFVLSIFGTFLVRSGMVSSVHAFASDPKRGILILELLGIILVVSILSYVWHWRTSSRANPQGETRDLKKLQWAILGNNVLLLLAAGAILFGTIYPLLYSLVTHKTIAVGYNFFNALFLPIILLMLCLMLATMLRPLRIVLVMIGSTIGATLLLYLWFNTIKIPALLGVTLAFSIIFANLANKTTSKNIIMLLAHTGLAIMIIGISISANYEVSADLSLQPGTKLNFANHELEFTALRNIDGPNYISYQAQLLVDGTKPLIAEKRIYLARELVTSEIGILADFWHDLYFALGSQLTHDSWSMRIYSKPAVRWIWGGAVLMAFAMAMGMCLMANARIKRAKQNVATDPITV